MEFLKLGNIVNYVLSLLIIVVAFILWKLIKKAYDANTMAMTQSKSKRRSTSFSILLSVLKYLILLIAFLLILDVNGVNITSMVAGIGIVSVILGLAIQDMLEDIIMGLHIVADNFFRVGDVVSYEGDEMIVLDFGLRTTRLESISTHNIYSVCNRLISSIQIISHQLDIDFNVPYEEDRNKVKDAIAALVNRINKLKFVESSEYKGVKELGNHSIIHKIRIFC